MITQFLPPVNTWVRKCTITINYDITLSSSNQKQWRKKRWNQKFCQSNFLPFSNQYFRFSPLVEFTTGLFEMIPLAFRICIIQFFQKSTLNCRQTLAMTTDIFVLNNKIEYKWNLKFHLEWLCMCYVIGVLEKSANSQPIVFSPEVLLSDQTRNLSHYCTVTIVQGQKISKFFLV